MTDRKPALLLVALHLGAIVLANVLAATYGPTATIYNAFALIGLDLITRDRLADFWGTTRWAKMSALIATGAALSYIATPGAGRIAIASGVSFAAAEGSEAILYYALRRREWLERANVAATLAAAVDSVVFPTLAFGAFIWSVSFGQFCAKVAGAFVWSVVIVRVRALRPGSEPA
jgi:queuosine precursor transporter